MGKLNVLDWIALVLVVVGGVNWGLVGLFNMDVVAGVLGDMTVATKAVYILVGLSAVYLAIISPKLSKQ